MLFSSPVDIDMVNMITIVVRRINNLYLINAIEEFGETNIADLYYGNTAPSGVANYSVYIFDDNFETSKVNNETVTITYGVDAPEDPKHLDLWLQDMNSIKEGGTT